MKFIEYKSKCLITKLKTIFIFDRKKRAEFKKNEIEKITLNFVSKMKWGVSYSVFDGEELLEASIRSIRNSVNYINVVWQEYSWNGKYKANPNLEKFLYSLKEKHLIDEIIKFEPDFNLRAGENEVNKRNLGLSYAQKNNVNFFMTMDCDEFYIGEELENVKKDILKNNITCSYCPIINYAEVPEKRILKLAGFSIPLFIKINSKTKLGYTKSVIALVDPTRRKIIKKGDKQFFFTNIQMHHFSSIRKDLEKKIRCSSCHKFSMQEVSVYKNRLAKEKTVEVENIFNI